VVRNNSVTTTHDLGMQTDEAPYRVVEREARTSSLLELWLRPPAARLRYRPGEYVLPEDCRRAIRAPSGGVVLRVR
jgi:NAD(P)H-flavin reductase